MIFEEKPKKNPGTWPINIHKWPQKPGNLKNGRAAGAAWSPTSLFFLVWKELVADNNAIICQQQSHYLCITEQLLVKNKQLFFHSNAIICYFAIAMQSFSPYNATHLSTTMQQVKRYKIIAKLLVSRWVGAVWGAALHNQSRRSWFGPWPVFGERVGGIILLIFDSDLDLRLRTIRTEVFSHKGNGNWPHIQLDSQLVDRMNRYYYQLDLVLIWLWKVFRTCVYFLPVVLKKCFKPLTYSTVSK